MAAVGDAGVERRHEAVLDRAVSELGLERGWAEQLYALAEEERLEPVYAFALVGCDMGVQQLAEVHADTEEGVAAQQVPPAWVGRDPIVLEDLELERRLRLSFRRFRTLLETEGDAVAAAHVYATQPDVGPLRAR